MSMAKFVSGDRVHWFACVHTVKDGPDGDGFYLVTDDNYLWHLAKGDDLEKIVEPKRLPDFTDYGWVHPTSKGHWSGYPTLTDAKGDTFAADVVFAYGVRDGELFIERVTGE